MNHQCGKRIALPALDVMCSLDARPTQFFFFFLRADLTRLFTIKDCSRLNKRTLWKGVKYPRTEQIQNHDSTNTLTGWLSSLEWKAPLILKQSSSYYSHNLYKNDPLLRIDSSKDCLISALSYRWTR